MTKAGSIPKKLGIGIMWKLIINLLDCIVLTKKGDEELIQNSKDYESTQAYQIFPIDNE